MQCSQITDNYKGECDGDGFLPLLYKGTCNGHIYFTCSQAIYLCNSDLHLHLDLLVLL